MTVIFHCKYPIGVHNTFSYHFTLQCVLCVHALYTISTLFGFITIRLKKRLTNYSP